MRSLLYSFIPLEDFKSILSINDQEDMLCRYCLVTATFTIEQYCMRRLLRKKHLERVEYIGELLLPLKEYPVNNVLSVYSITKTGSEIIELDFYSIIPDCGSDEDIPFNVSFSPALKRYRGLTAVKIIYLAGYNAGKAPPDLASACLELAAWNMTRYKGRRIGMSGNIRGNGRDGEHLEMSIPENVRQLLEPYKRKII